MNACLLFLVLASASGDAIVDVHPGDELARMAGASGDRLLLPAGESVELSFRAPRPAHAVGLWWSGAVGDGRLTLEASPAGPWYPVVEDHDQSPEIVGVERPAGSRRVSGLVVHSSNAGRTARLRLVGPTDLRDLCVVWIFAQRETSGPVRRPKQFVGGYPKPTVFPRSFWGAAPPTCSYSYCNTTHVGVHHSASSSHWNSTTLAQCATNVLGMQTFHMVTNGWCDLGYNYVVCKHGDIFEGRGGGDDVRGAHDGKNCGSMGVCNMGYFHAPFGHVPTSEMIDALVDLTAWKCAQQGIDPLGSSFYAGLGATMTNIYGHRDVSATACPGDQFYALMGALRSAVDGLLNCGSPTTYGTPQISSQPAVTGIAWTGSPSASINDFVVVGTGFKAASFAWILAGGGVGSNVQPFGTILVMGPGYTRTLAGTTDVVGDVALAWPVIAAMVGTTQNFQWAVRDPGWGGGITLSQGLTATYCP